MQTLAQINLLAAFYDESWTLPCPTLRRIFEYFSSMYPGGTTVRQRCSMLSVEVVYIDRDDAHSSHERVYVIANGWYMHPLKNKDNFNFPFSQNIVPLFISFHCANKKILSPGVVGYLQEHSPIGCRDLATLGMLKHFKIPAYFSGCLTSCIRVDMNSGSYKNGSCISVDVLRGHNNTTHKVCSQMSRENRLSRALNLLQDYAGCASLQSSRIHCVLPAKAVQARNVAFTPPANRDITWYEQDRLDGLLQLMSCDKSREVLAMAISAHVIEQLDYLLVEEESSFNHDFSSSSCSLGIYPSPVTFDISKSPLLVPWSCVRLLAPSRITTSFTENLDDVCAGLPFIVKISLVNTLTYIFSNIPTHAFTASTTVYAKLDDDIVEVSKTLSSQRDVLITLVVSNITDLQLMDLRQQTRKYSNVLLMKINKKTERIELFVVVCGLIERHRPTY